MRVDGVAWYELLHTSDTPTLNGAGFSWWWQSPRQSTSYFRGVRPNYLAKARIREGVDSMHLPSVSRPSGAKTRPARSAPGKSNTRHRFYPWAFPTEPPT